MTVNLGSGVTANLCQTKVRVLQKEYVHEIQQINCLTSYLIVKQKSANFFENFYQKRKLSHFVNLPGITQKICLS
jgi:hypothetical protein